MRVVPRDLQRVVVPQGLADHQVVRLIPGWLCQMVRHKRAGKKYIATDQQQQEDLHFAAKFSRRQRSSVSFLLALQFVFFKLIDLHQQCVLAVNMVAAYKAQPLDEVWGACTILVPYTPHEMIAGTVYTCWCYNSMRSWNNLERAFLMNTSSTNWAVSGWWPTFQTPDHLDVYDIRSASQDTQLALTTLTGVINRQKPQVYLLSSADAAFWLQEVFVQMPHEVSPATGNTALDAMLNTYASSIRGMIIYDPNSIDSI